MAFIRKIKGSLVKLDVTDYIGEDSYMFYDIVTGSLRIHDGTPGGAIITGAGSGGSWGGITGTITDQTDLVTFVGSEIDLAIGPDLIGNSIITTADQANGAIQDIADFIEINGQEIVDTGITTITTVDSAVATIAKWIIRIEQVGTPANVYATELIAAHNGTAVDSAKYAILTTGSPINDLNVTVTLTGGNTLNVNVESTDSVDVVIKRIMVV